MIVNAMYKYLKIQIMVWMTVWGISACGLKSGLYLPSDVAAKDRATLPQTLFPSSENQGKKGVEQQHLNRNNEPNGEKR